MQTMEIANRNAKDLQVTGTVNLHVFADSTSRSLRLVQNSEEYHYCMLSVLGEAFGNAMSISKEVECYACG